LGGWYLIIRLNEKVEMITIDRDVPDVGKLLIFYIFLFLVFIFIFTGTFLGLLFLKFPPLDQETQGVILQTFLQTFSIMLLALFLIPRVKAIDVLPISRWKLTGIYLWWLMLGILFVLFLLAKVIPLTNISFSISVSFFITSLILLILYFRLISRSNPYHAMVLLSKILLHPTASNQKNVERTITTIDNISDILVNAVRENDSGTFREGLRQMEVSGEIILSSSRLSPEWKNRILKHLFLLHERIAVKCVEEKSIENFKPIVHQLAALIKYAMSGEKGIYRDNQLDFPLLILTLKKIGIIWFNYHIFPGEYEVIDHLGQIAEYSLNLERQGLPLYHPPDIQIINSLQELGVICAEKRMENPCVVCLVRLQSIAELAKNSNPRVYESALKSYWILAAYMYEYIPGSGTWLIQSIERMADFFGDDFPGALGTAAAEMQLISFAGMEVLRKFRVELSYGVLKRAGISLKILPGDADAGRKSLSAESDEGDDSFYLENPYKTGRPVQNPEMFFGRKDIIARIVERLSSNNIIILCGQRRTGKTSTLFQLKNVIYKDRAIPVFLTVQSMMGSDANFFFFRMAEEVYKSIKEFVSLPEPAIVDFEKNPQHKLERFLEKAVKEIKNKPIIYLIDEFDGLFQMIEEKKIKPSLLDNLRSIMQHIQEVWFLLAGTNALKQKAADYRSALFNIATYEKISILNETDARELIVNPLKGQVKYEPYVVDKIISLTNSHPYFIQMICFELVNYLEKVHSRSATVKELNVVVNEILNKGSTHFDHYWTYLSKDEQLFISLLAENMMDYETMIPIDRVMVFSKADFKPGMDIYQLISGLKEKELVTEKTIAGKNHIGFFMDIFRRWILLNQPSKMYR
jgi:AAA+ ATPase superfamily predicted ATPase